MSALLLVFLAVGFASGVPVYHRVQVHSGTMTVTEDLMVDIEADYVIVTVGDVNTGPFIPFVNMHDMESGFSAYKNITGGKCLIEPLQQTMDEITTRIDNIKNGREVSDLKQITWNCNKQSVPYQVLEEKTGSRIASFCKDYLSYFVTRLIRPTRAVGSTASYGSFCLFCAGGCR